MTSRTRKAKPVKVPRRAGVPRVNLNRETREGKQDPVGGVIQGKKAYSTEVMWAKAIHSTGHDFIFQYEVETAYTLPGQEKQVDFLVDGRYADEVDGEIGHKTESQKNKDLIRDIQINNVLQQYGVNPIRRIDAAMFRDQSKVNQMAREHYG